MGEDVIKLPLVKLEVPKPKPWDLIALLFVVAAVAAAGYNLSAALGRQAGAVSDATTAGMVTIQLLICGGSLLILGKTAKHGTLWGNLAAVTGLLAGMSGVLLAAALWTTA